jgi:predicted Zn-dependent protease
VIDVVPLSESEGAAVPLFLRSMRESTSVAEVKAAVAEARQLASRYPKEPMAQDVLAEFELDAEQFDAARAANAAVLAAKPSNSRALLRSARIEIAQMKGKGDDAQWKAVRSLIIKANRAAPDDPFPLWMFYQWHMMSGNAAPKIAIDGLRRGLELAPQVPELRFAFASRLVRDGKKDDARLVLAPLINDPHSPEIRDAAAKLLNGDDSEALLPDEKPVAKIHTRARNRS